MKRRDYKNKQKFTKPTELQKFFAVKTKLREHTRRLKRYGKLYSEPLGESELSATPPNSVFIPDCEVRPATPFSSNPLAMEPHKIPYSFILNSQLNGVNGECTCKDDVKGRQPRKQQKTQKIILVEKTKKGKKGKSRKSVPRSLTTDAFTKTFMCAFNDGFSSGARGCRAPVETGFPTDTYVIRGEVIMGNGQANGSVAFFSNPLVSMCDCGVASGGPAVALSSSSLQQLGSSGLFGVTVQSNLAAVMLNYRVVNVTLRIRNPAAITVAQGRLIVAPIICTEDVPTIAMLDLYLPQTGVGPYSNFLQVAPAAANGAFILNLPGAREYSMAELASADLTLRLKPITFDAYSFKNSYPTYTYSASYVEGDELAITSGTGLNAQTSIGYSDEASSKGWSGFIINMEGVQTTGSVLAVEFIYHLEGMPAFAATNAAIKPVPSNQTSYSLPSSSALGNVRDWAARQPLLSWLEDQAGELAVYAGRKAVSAAKSAWDGYSGHMRLT